MMEVVFETPPDDAQEPGTKGRRVSVIYDEFFATIKKRPGEWARWPRTYKGSAVVAVQSAAKVRKVDPDDLEFRLAIVENGHEQVWVRWVA